MKAGAGLSFSSVRLLSVVLSIFSFICYACMPNGYKNKVTIGETTFICVYLAPINWTQSGEYIMIPVEARADKLTRIRVPQSWTSSLYQNDTLMQRIQVTDTYGLGVGSGVSLASMGVLSYQRIYREVRRWVDPTPSPTGLPSFAPSHIPIINSTLVPTLSPIVMHSEAPTVAGMRSRRQLLGTDPTSVPTGFPTSPTSIPSSQPSMHPSSSPTRVPSRQPLSVPSSQPSGQPVAEPTCTPSSQPSTQPTSKPSTVPSKAPVSRPTSQPSSQPIQLPSTGPTSSPSAIPTYQSSLLPSSQPSSQPSFQPSSQPSIFNISGLLETHYEPITFPLLFAIILVEKGKVKSIAWDNFCSWCSSKYCAGNTVNYDDEVVSGEGGNCFVPDSDCYVDIGDKDKVTGRSVNALCELSIYIAWYGTDSSGANFQSAAYRFSRWSDAQMTNFTSVLMDEAARA